MLRAKHFIFIFILLQSSLAFARPGFYFGLGFGPTGVNGSPVENSQLQPDERGSRLSGLPTGTTTDIDGGISGLFRLGFNILGYGAFESYLTGFGNNLGDADVRSWAAHWQSGIRVYPLWHWQHLLPDYLQPLEPSLFAGVGLSYQGSPPAIGYDEMGYSKRNSWSLGTEAEYFFAEYFRLGLAYNYIRANYNDFIFNYDNSENFPLDPPAKTGFHQMWLTLTFQFGSDQKAVRYN